LKLGEKPVAEGSGVLAYSVKDPVWRKTAMTWRTWEPIQKESLIEWTFPVI
jgi:hypothetical protein